MARQLVALATSVLTLIGMWLAGNRRASGWLVGLVNQALWFGFIVAFDAWGLLPLNAALIVVYSRNLRKWRQPAVVDASNGYVDRDLLDEFLAADGPLFAPDVARSLLCTLQAIVSHANVTSFPTAPADCFCAVPRLSSWQNHGESVRFIIRATLRELGEAV